MDTTRPKPSETENRSSTTGRFAGVRDTSRPGRGPFPPRRPNGEPAEEDPDEKNSNEENPGENSSNENSSNKNGSDEDGSDEDRSGENESGENESGGKTSVDETPSSSEEDPGSSEEVSSWEEIRIAYVDGDKRIGREETARRILRKRSFLVPKGADTLYVWDPDAGIYRKSGREALEEILAEKLGPYHTTREVRQVLAKVKAKAPVGKLGQAKVIPLEGKDLVVDADGTGKVVLRPREPGPERRIGARAQARWSPAAEPEVFDDLLRKSIPSGKDRQVLQDYAGYGLLRWRRPYRRALVLAGPEGSGRAPIMEALSWLYGRVSSVRPSRLARGRSGTLPPGTWANICHEADSQALARLPLLSGPMVGDSPAENDPSGANVLSGADVPSGADAGSSHTAKHIYSVSDLPPLAAGDPFFRKVLLVSCPETLGAGEEGPGEDGIGEIGPGGVGPRLRRALWEERDGILQWALEGLRRVLKGAQNGEGFPSGRTAKTTRRRWDQLGGPIGRFKDAYLEVTGKPEDVIVKSRLYKAYRGFCQREGVLVKLIDRFTPTLLEDPLIGDDRRTPEPGADQARCYIGAKPKRDLDPLIAEAQR